MTEVFQPVESSELKISRKALTGIIAIVVLCALAAFAALLFRPPETPAFTQLPPNNAFTNWIDAGNRVVGDPFRATNDLKGFVRSNEIAFRIFDSSLTNRAEAPLDGLTPVTPFHRIALALGVKARAFEEAGNDYEAAKTYLSILQMGQGIEHGSTVNLLQGKAVEMIALGGLKSTFPKLTPIQRRELATRGLELCSRRISFDEVLARDRYWLQKSEPNPFKRVLYRAYWHLTFFGFRRAPDLRSRYEAFSRETEDFFRKTLDQN